MIYVILGQTASGKTDVALKLCRKYNLPLLGSDVYQMYKEMKVGTAKPSLEELEGIEYHFINDISVEDEISVKEYQDKARKILDKYLLEGRDVVISGGTFLYLRALLYPYSFEDEEDFSYEKYDCYSSEELFNRLKNIDEEAASKLHVNNRRRVIRALAIAESGVKKSEREFKVDKYLYPCRIFNIEIDKEVGNSKIDKRVDEMVSEGLFEEANELFTKFGTELNAFKAIGYKEIIEGRENNSSKEEIIERIKIDTRQYAKRQRTFLRHQFKNIVSLKKDEIFDYISFDIERRKRNKASITPTKLNKIENSKVMVVGVGGVGSILASSLVRLGVASIVLVDRDEVDVSNLNRQIAYVKKDISRRKVEALKDHLLEIDPYFSVVTHDASFSKDLVEDDVDFVFDCIDDVEAKCDIYEICKEKNIKVIHATGSGLRMDASKYFYGSLNDTSEPLAKKFKKVLLSRGEVDLSKVNVAYSKEVPQKKLTSYIGSNVACPNAEGLTMLSFFILNI